YEWCHDWYLDSYYSVSPAQNPTGPTIGTRKASRGGYWTTPEETCIIFNRYSFEPVLMAPYLGFRIAKTK
ncbi:MAG: formylglycine-generating enzyme family protein, partial [Thermotogota bacterium]